MHRISKPPGPIREDPPSDVLGTGPVRLWRHSSETVAPKALASS